MIEKLKTYTRRKINDARGWKTNRKILVIESDDWGSVRMPNRKVYDTLLEKGFPVDKNPYEKYDSLASEQDIQALYEVLCTVKDKNGNNAVLTPNVIMTNPDFDKIEQSQFQEYHYEHFTKTLKSYGKTHEHAFNLWKEGIESNIFHPQYHGREHLNIRLFMNELKANNIDLHFAFKEKTVGCLIKSKTRYTNNFVETNYFKTKGEEEFVKNNYLIGHKMFTKEFGYKSISVIPPNYIWSPRWDEYIYNKGVMAFQGISKISEPNLSKNNINFNYYKVYLGKINNLGQIYLVRNVFFEPSNNTNLSYDQIINKTLKQVSNSFFWKKPAIISSHRLNYVGVIDESNRTNNLRMLEQILKTVVQKWPEVEFMSSDQLVNEIINS